MGARLRRLIGWSPASLLPSRDRGRKGAVPMSTYIMFGSWTDQGISAIAESPRRLDAAKGMLAEMGGRFVNFFMTMGEYDMVAIYEAPDDAVAARFSLMVGRMGNVRTRTVKAFPEEAMRQIIASLR
jgi:uncharacterized protein with GYD domain